MDIQFANKEALYFLFVIPVLAALFFLFLTRRRKALQKIGSRKVVLPLIEEYSSSRPIIKAVFLLVAFSFLIVAVARPRMGTKLKEVSAEGSEIMICLDISNSMRATDMYPSRLENTKNAISSLVKKLSNDKVGLIIFAGTAFVQVPLTQDLKATDIFVQSVSCDMISEQGTALGAALDLALKSFNYDNDMAKAVILISDGENHEANPDPMKLASQCAEKGVTVHVIGTGDVRGVPIPKREGSSDYIKDSQGNVVVSKLDEASLKQIANLGGGVYIRATNGNSGFNTVYDHISKMKKGEYTSFAEYDEKFGIPAFISLVFFLAYCLTLNRKNRWIKKLGIFE
ncbi:MAG: VWA domain-containing protein [Bacteroidales bacterium]|nr:VWA domain-containing protein [Bacteroidales bacterium]